MHLDSSDSVSAGSRPNVRSEGLIDFTLPTPERLGDLLSQFVRSLTGAESPDAVLRDLSRAAAALQQVDGAGVLVIEPDRVRVVAASSDAAGVAEQAQALAGGPAQSSHRRKARVALADLSRARSWPEFSTAALAAGFLSVVSLPLYTGVGVWGVLDLYRTIAAPVGPDALAAAQALVDVATSTILTLREREVAAEVLADLSHRALHDPLTGLANRALFADRLDHAVAARRRHQGAIVVIFIDLNNFKSINDTFGHAAGDQVLQEVARRFSAVTRDEDTVARLGGDEFAVLSSSPSNSAGPAAVASWAAHSVDRLADSLLVPVELAGTLLHLRASVGMAIAGLGQESADELVHAADTAMYQFKHHNPAMVEIEFDPHHHVEQQSGSRLVGDLRRAAAADAEGDEDAFPIVYQPVVELRGGVRVRPRRQLEALLRWKHPTRGLLEASEFVQVAERTDLIVGIGDSVLRRACLLAANWQDSAFDSSVAVNVSAVELRSPGFVDRVRSAVHAADIDASWLRLEITEKSMLEAGGRIDATTAQLKEFGVGLSLDGFGTGLSSLTHLERFPIDAVKLDRSVVTRLGDEMGTGMIDGVLSVTRALGLEAAAGGVETAAQLAGLRWLGCDHAQGFLLGRPMSAADVMAGRRSTPPSTETVLQVAHSRR